MKYWYVCGMILRLRLTWKYSIQRTVRGWERTDETRISVLKVTVLHIEYMCILYNIPITSVYVLTSLFKLFQSCWKKIMKEMVHIIDYMNKIKNCSALLKQKAGENICYEYGRQRVNIHFHAHTCTYICIYELTEKRLRTQ